ncbi:hypothetical protein [Niallia endozanthoxylica]|uniref:Uncharacterized protein n=1 Tax=Niallia endozanthoxylica TaxID=2036016 RepID=A0A5J5GVA3_9BACI|nr:hypothetical protein [Niallia endozanthoxylica]KAA9012399.1 hypothetical protein F4V44_25735 [Niallia endozanthoxylica]
MLIKKIEDVGSWFSITKKNKLKIHGVKNIPPDILDAVKKEKDEIQNIIHVDYIAKSKGWIVAIPGELYTLQTSKFTGVFIEKTSDKLWESWRETWKDGERNSSSCYVIVEGASFRRALGRATDYISFLNNNKKRGNI